MLQGLMVSRSNREQQLCDALLCRAPTSCPPLACTGQGRVRGDVVLIHYQEIDGAGVLWLVNTENTLNRVEGEGWPFHLGTRVISLPSQAPASLNLPTVAYLASRRCPGFYRKDQRYQRGAEGVKLRNPLTETEQWGPNITLTVMPLEQYYTSAEANIVKQLNKQEGLSFQEVLSIWQGSTLFAFNVLFTFTIATLPRRTSSVTSAEVVSVWRYTHTHTYTRALNKSSTWPFKSYRGRWMHCCALQSPSHCVQMLLFPLQGRCPWDLLPVD